MVEMGLMWTSNSFYFLVIYTSAVSVIPFSLMGMHRFEYFSKVNFVCLQYHKGLTTLSVILELVDWDATFSSKGFHSTLQSFQIFCETLLILRTS